MAALGKHIPISSESARRLAELNKQIESLQLAYITTIGALVTELSPFEGAFSFQGITQDGVGRSYIKVGAR